MISLKQTEIIDELCNEICNNRNTFLGCVEVYLFGSFLTRNNPNDIDILVVYDDSKCSVIKQVNEVEKLVEKISGYPVDMTALSIAEKQETLFLDKLNNKYLKII